MCPRDYVVSSIPSRTTPESENDMLNCCSSSSSTSMSTSVATVVNNNNNNNNNNSSSRNNNTDNNVTKLMTSSSTTMPRVVVRVLCNSTMLEERKRRLSTMSTAMSISDDASSSSSTMAATSLTMKENKAMDNQEGQEGQEDGCVKDTWSNVSYFIDYFHLTPDEADKVLELQKRLVYVQHYYNSPMWAIRYLKTKLFDVDATEVMMHDTLHWRRTHRVDTILAEYVPPAGLLDKYPGAILREPDREGDPIFINRTGVTDLAGLLDKYGQEEMLKYEVYRREVVMVGPWVEEWERRTGRPIRTSVLIEDLHGLSRQAFVSKAIKYYGLVTELDGAYYAETNKKIFVIRAPTIFRMIWSVVKRFFDPHIVDKMVFCGEKDYLQVLERHMDLEVLPPCIYPRGRGAAVEGHPPNFDGGKVV